MTFWLYITQKGQDRQTLNERLVERFSELTARGHSIADLLAHYGDEFGHLPAERLRDLAREHRAWVAWGRRRSRLDEVRQQAKLPALPDEVIQRALTPDELDAVARAARLCSPTEAGGAGPWVDQLTAGLELWRACMRLVRKRGRLVCRPKNPEHPDVALYEAYIDAGQAHSGSELGELAPHRWLAMRRGERQGVLLLELQLPLAELAAQAELYHARLARGPVEERSPASLLEELVTNDLGPWLLTILDGESEAGAIQAACESLLGLLRAIPLQARRVGAIYPAANRAVAVVIADREGELTGQRVLRSEGGWVAKAAELLEQHKVHHVVLPTGAAQSESLGAVEQQLAEAGFQIQRVRAAALAEAREPLTRPPQRLSASVASALVLARRVVDPIKAWSAVDPVSIGLCEYQNDLDQDRLRIALSETLELYRLERRRSKPAGPGPAARAPAVVGRLNPMVRSAADLRPGMQVKGVVTNVSHFGAFISLGLPQEALVHISELSDDFVANPNEVVAIGQQVTAYVLSVDSGRGRISLSMKSRRASETNGRKPNGAKTRENRARPQTRAEALASLERLFKK